MKLTTDNGITGIGEVYCATFGPKAMTAMIEDVFDRHVAGHRSLRDLEALWRRVYGAGYTLRPDVSLMGVLSGIEIALWDIKGKASASRSMISSAAACTRSCAPIPTSIRISPNGQDDSIYWNAEQSAERAAHYVKHGFTGIKFDPAAPYSVFDPRQPSLESIELCGKFCKLMREAVGTQGGPAVRHAWPVHDVRRHPPCQADRAL